MDTGQIRFLLSHDGNSPFFFYRYFFGDFLLWRSGLRTQHSVREDAGLISGLTRWVKDLALLWLWHWLVAAALI